MYPFTTPSDLRIAVVFKYIILLNEAKCYDYYMRLLLFDVVFHVIVSLIDAYIFDRCTTDTYQSRFEKLYLSDLV